MNKIAQTIAIASSVVLLTIAIVVIENKSYTPMERFLETSQTTKKSEAYVPDKIISDGGDLEYEFLSYELIDDEDIEKQTKYKAEYFRNGKVPSSDYVATVVDYAAMRRDYPKYDEYLLSNGEKGMTEAEAEEFERKHEADYSSEKHIKTKYLFIRCRITYIGGKSNEVSLGTFNFFLMSGDTLVGLNGPDCYFDRSQCSDADKRMSAEFFMYKFEKVGDSMECVFGGMLREDVDGLSKATAYYVGFQSENTYDCDQFNPAIDKKCIALNDLPKEP
jgi:hypothetical protein